MLRALTGRTVLRPRWERTLAALRVTLTLGFFVSLFFVFGLTPGRLAGAVGDADGLPLALAFAVLAVVMVLLAFKWYMLAGALNIRTSFSAITRLYFVGTVLNNVLPTAIGGDVYRVYFLSREGNASVKRSLASVIMERATGYAGLLLLAVAAACFYFLGLLPGVAASLALLVVLGLSYPLLGRLRRNGSPANDHSWRWWRNRPLTSSLYGIAALSVVQQSLWITVAALLGLAYDANVAWSYWALTVTAVTLLTMLPISVGGLGVREVGYASLLAPVGVDAGRAAAIGLAIGFGPAIVSLAGLVLFMAMGFRPQRSPLLASDDIEEPQPERIG